MTRNGFLALGGGGGKARIDSRCFLGKEVYRILKLSCLGIDGLILEKGKEKDVRWGNFVYVGCLWSMGEELGSSVWEEGVKKNEETWLGIVKNFFHGWKAVIKETGPEMIGRVQAYELSCSLRKKGRTGLLPLVKIKAFLCGDRIVTLECWNLSKGSGPFSRNGLWDKVVGGFRAEYRDLTKESCLEGGNAGFLLGGVIGILGIALGSFYLKKWRKSGKGAREGK